MTVSTKKAKTLSDFRAAHDKNFIIPKRIESALKSLADDSPEAWEYEIEFIKRAGLATTQLAEFRDQFEDFIVTVASTHSRGGKRIWCGTKALAAKLRTMAGS